MIKEKLKSIAKPSKICEIKNIPKLSILAIEDDIVNTDIENANVVYIKIIGIKLIINFI